MPACGYLIPFIPRLFDYDTASRFKFITTLQRCNTKQASGLAALIEGPGATNKGVESGPS
jgi:hypothetical protein